MRDIDVMLEADSYPHRVLEITMADDIDRAIERLERDYRDRFVAAGASGFDAWGNGAKIGVEARFGRPTGPMWGPSQRYARRTGVLGLFGPLVPFRSVEDAERDLRIEIEQYLAKLAAGHKPRMFGRE